MNTKGKIMRKLLGQSTAAVTENADASNGDSPQRPSASQNTIYSAGAPIACLDRSSNGQRAVIAGSKVFKILKIDGTKITEEVDLRAVITSYATTHDLSAATPEQLNIRAVRWSHGHWDSTIITASGNGRITSYDLHRLDEGFGVWRNHEHTRQVHKLAISPFRPDWVLSASQDGTVRMFDQKLERSKIILKCNADAVRDVKWNPVDGYSFACCTDAGVVQKWDIRNPSAPALKLTAHTSSCFCISYHPDGTHVISGGIDQLCHVWDLSKTAERNQKPKYTFSTPAPISKVCWRPACWSATAHGKRAAQVAVAYDDSNASRNQTSNVHIWDLARSSMPFKEIEKWDSAPTGMLWNTRDLLWTVDKEGRFMQTDVAFVPQLINRRSLSNFSFSPTGDVLMLLEERPSPRRPRLPIPSPNVSPSVKPDVATGPLLSVSRSDSEEDVVGSFLGPRQRKAKRRSQTQSTTPPNPTGMVDASVMNLDAAVKVTGVYKPQQVMAIGHAPSSTKRGMYQYLSNQYLLRMAESLTTHGSTEGANTRMSSIMEAFARAVEHIGQYRLAQTWRLLGFTMNLLLTRRAEYHRRSRLTVAKSPLREKSLKEALLESRPRTVQGEETPRRYPRAQTPASSPKHKTPISKVAEEIESTSNVATPLVRPAYDNIVYETHEAMHTPLLVEDDVLHLPESVLSTTPSPIPVPGARQTEEHKDHTSSSVEGYDFYGMDSFRPVIDFVAPPRKQPLWLDYHEHSNPSRIQSQRHDSAESFQMFSTSSDSHNGRFMSSSGSDVHSAKGGRTLRERVSSWENSPAGHLEHRQSIDSNAPTQSETSDDTHVTSGSHEIHAGIPTDKPPLPSSPPIFRIQEASVPIDNDPTPKKAAPEDLSPTSSEKASQDPGILESDFLPWPNDPDFLIHPINPITLVQRTINFEVQTGALTAAVMILLLCPLLPLSAIDEIQASAIIRQYHHRLTDMKLVTEAALLRNICVPKYPTVFAAAQENIKIGFFCTDCHKPIENDPLVEGSEWTCPRCERNMDSCVVCRSREMNEPNLYDEDRIVEASKGRIWWLCPGCGHGGHSTCMQAWHSGPESEEGDEYSGGCCPLEGCLHPCLPGNWRETRFEEKKASRARELELLVRENSRTGSRAGGRAGGIPVRRDMREVNQSKAVEGVRVALGLGGGGGLERKKSVKLVAPGEE